MECVVCGAQGTRFWVERNGYALVRCPVCRSGFVDPTPVTDLSTLYEEPYYRGDGRRSYADYEGERSFIRGTANRVLEWLEAFVPPGRLVEVGCGMGFFLEAAVQRGWLAAGLDISAHAVGVARQTLGFDVRCGDVTTSELVAGGGQVDAVVALDVIEHLAQPGRLLANARSAIRPGGALLLSTGELGSWSARAFGTKWRLLEPPEHLFYFTRVGLGVLLERHGFSVVAARRFWRTYSLRAVLGSLGLKPPRPIAHLPVPVNAFDVMYVLARPVASR